MRIIVGFQAEGTTPPHIRTLRVTVPSGSSVQGNTRANNEAGGGGNATTQPPRVTHHLVIEEGEEEVEEEEEYHLADEPDYLLADKMGECSLSIIDKSLARLFHWLGVKIGQNPSYFIIIPLFVALLLGTGMQRLIYIDDPEYLFSPVDGAAKTERLVIEELFPMNYTHRFHPSRFVRPGRFARYVDLYSFIHLIFICMYIRFTFQFIIFFIVSCARLSQLRCQKICVIKFDRLSQSSLVFRTFFIIVSREIHIMTLTFKVRIIYIVYS